jgi:hypothetical protein
MARTLSNKQYVDYYTDAELQIVNALYFHDKPQLEGLLRTSMDKNANFL